METTSNSKQCHFCKEEIHQDAIKCKHCGSMLSTSNSPIENSEKSGSLWISIVSLVFGVLLIAVVLDGGEWDKDSIEGFVSLCAISLGFGILGIVKKLNGEGMAIAGVVLSSLAILIAVSN